MIILLCTIFLSAFLVCVVLIRQKQCLIRANLPPGSMGWPYIGETFNFYSQNPNQLFAQKQKRYGEIFKTHLLGYPCVMLASPEAARFVLVSQSRFFKPTYPKSKMQLIGPSALFFHQGDHHARFRKLVQSPLSPESISGLIPSIDATAVSALDSWVDGCVINTVQEMKKFTSNVGILSIFGQLEARYTKELKNNYTVVEKGYNSFPTSIPGTLYNNAVLARKRLSKIVSEIICERRETTMGRRDILSSLMDYQYDKGRLLSDEQIADKRHRSSVRGAGHYGQHSDMDHQVPS